MFAEIGFITLIGMIRNSILNSVLIWEKIIPNKSYSFKIQSSLFDSVKIRQVWINEYEYFLKIYLPIPICRYQQLKMKVKNALFQVLHI